jgi:SWI/SNF-related matrix-associated actin-dependent regulator 1 of chromatin subfamily A
LTEAEETQVIAASCPKRVTADPEEPEEFSLKFPYDQAILQSVKAIPGRIWDPDDKSWRIPVSEQTSRQVFDLAEANGFYVCPAALAVMADNIERAARLEEASRAEDGTGQLKAQLGKELRPFQKAGVEYALKTKRLFFADSMGLGKTPQALATVEEARAYPCVIVCPASLKLNWEREANQWLPGRRVAIINSGSDGIPLGVDLLVVNYDLLAKSEKRTVAGRKKQVEVYPLVDAIRSMLKPVAVVLDESHYIKNGDAKRSKACYELGEDVEWKLCLSGTFLLNRPFEAVSQLRFLNRLKDFGGYWSFVKRYCGAKQGHFGWDFSGATHLQELNDLLRSTCYVRRTIEQVAKEIPPKSHQVIYLPIDNRKEYDRADNDFTDWLGSDDVEDGMAQEVVRIEKLKQLAAMGMLKAFLSWAEDFLETTGEKLVIFAWHKAVVAKVADHFHDCSVSITGDTSLKDRQLYVDAFQNDPACRVIVGNIQAMGVGLTLTASCNVCFVELGYTPAEMEQAEDRCIAEGQLILTPTGWKPIEFIEIGDSVIAGDGLAHIVTDAWSRGSLKLMTDLTVEGWPLRVTMTSDHLCLLESGEWKPAGELKPGDLLARPAAIGGKKERLKVPASVRVASKFQGPCGEQRNGRASHLPDSIELGQETLFVMGYYVGDGFASIGSDKGRFISFAGHEHKDANTFNRVKKWLKTLGVNYGLQHSPGYGMELRGYSTELARLFHGLFGHGARFKKLPKEFLTLSRDQSQWLLNGLIASDGYRRRGHSEYCTVSPELASQLARLVINAGYVPRVGRGNAGSYIISFADSKNGTSGLVRSVTNRFPKKTNGKRERVYDLTVDGESSFVVGLSVVHNCYRIGQTKPVTVRWFIPAETIYEDVAKLLSAKQTVVDAATDGTTEKKGMNILKDLMAKWQEKANKKK